ncbi:o-succinylbenzoate synthase [Carboxylicivirga sediminis]|uniref:O-succinylbenzoate synthase n=1 Tax=Carboxylicivirga sediminis TaxID=2006564 RepID=A0A941F2R9_9BACT|nr:o-succinylbenzoate synthase [Carboxylicivirga sediminis]MBR8535239.1 o-succinylbenzoate synthase [Carboxylicivirga sediminis]
MLTATYKKQELVFKEAGGTSRGVLETKPSWFIKIENNQGIFGIGECSIIPGLSMDDSLELDVIIADVCTNINDYVQDYHQHLKDVPALRFAIETALKGLQVKHPYELYPSQFTSGNEPIVINGLIWMGEAETMLKRIEEKLKQGFSCLKLKVGAIDFNEELRLLRHIRNRYSEKDLELRLDANGAFSPVEALSKLEALSSFKIHSIEQPIEAGQYEDMFQLCRKTTIPIALDEELIGVNDMSAKAELLRLIMPQYIILKPSLLGGVMASDEWISIADELNIGWWATSALEANIGLNAIAQWVATKNSSLRQGLGTGQVFTNNLRSPLYLKGQELYYNPHGNWENPFEANDG